MAEGVLLEMPGSSLTLLKFSNSLCLEDSIAPEAVARAAVRLFPGSPLSPATQFLGRF